MTKISKPRLTKLKMSEMWCCEGGYIAYASTPEKAYNDWLAKERAEPYHIYSERTIRECLERIEKMKKEKPETFEKKYYSACDAADKVEASTLTIPYWCCVTEYYSGSMVRFGDDIYELMYNFDGTLICSTSDVPNKRSHVWFWLGSYKEYKEFEEGDYSASDAETETGIGIKYIDPKTMSNTTVDKKKPWWRFW